MRIEKTDVQQLWVVLLDGASYDLKSDANRIDRATGEQETGGFFSKLQNLL